jgi:hypothetical protein
LRTPRNTGDGRQGDGVVSRTIRIAARSARRLAAGRVLRQFILACAGLTLLAAAGGCAAITTGTSQAINVNSDPGEADCTLTREGRQLGTVKTPGPVKVQRESKTIQVVCRKEGYRDGETTMDARFETATLGNLILGGVVGLAVDAASGANQRYDGFVMVHLTPLAGMQSPIAAAQSTTPAIPPPPVAAVYSRAAATAGDRQATSGPPPAPPGAGSWKCGINNIGNSANPYFTLRLVVGTDHTITVVNYANASVAIVKGDPLTFTAINPRGSRLTTFTWQPDNSMTITGPGLNNPASRFYNEGTCTKEA